MNAVGGNFATVVFFATDEGGYCFFEPRMNTDFHG